VADGITVADRSQSLWASDAGSIGAGWHTENRPWALGPAGGSVSKPSLRYLAVGHQHGGRRRVERDPQPGKLCAAHGPGRLGLVGFGQ
jgi:hypothetical protein